MKFDVVCELDFRSQSWHLLPTLGVSSKMALFCHPWSLVVEALKEADSLFFKVLGMGPSTVT